MQQCLQIDKAMDLLKALSLTNFLVGDKIGLLSIHLSWKDVLLQHEELPWFRVVTEEIPGIGGMAPTSLHQYEFQTYH